VSCHAVEAMPAMMHLHCLISVWPLPKLSSNKDGNKSITLYATIFIWLIVVFSSVFLHCYSNINSIIANMANRDNILAMLIREIMDVPEGSSCHL